jgi:hypothetical protein
MIDSLRETYKLFRWRFVPLRYAGRLRYGVLRPPATTPIGQRQHEIAALEAEGYTPGPTLEPLVLDAIRAKYVPRTGKTIPVAGGHPFKNIITDHDLTEDDPLVGLAFSPTVLDVAHDYFGGHATLDSIQLLYSWPTEGISESQMWHKDYGDDRSLHWIAYLDDVTSDSRGPFVFVDRRDTARIRRSPFIRRIPDDRFIAELGAGKVRKFLGSAGSSIYVDPSACYHYGSRCKIPRMAIFITFNSWRPFVSATDLVRHNACKLLEIGSRLRPDLTSDFLRRLLPDAAS